MPLANARAVKGKNAGGRFNDNLSSRLAPEFQARLGLQERIQVRPALGVHGIEGVQIERHGFVRMPGQQGFHRGL